MNYLQTVILGIVQGIAEFLPISSSGHLVLAGSLFDLHMDNMAFNVALHVGTLVSILVVYQDELRKLLTQPRVIAAIVLATLPAAVVGLLLHDQLEQTFESPLVAGWGLCVTAGLLWSTRFMDRGATALADVSMKQALVVGSCQVAALVPGISRSGTTIFAGLLSGLNRQTAATFSFLVAIPVIAGAATLETWKVIREGRLSQAEWGMYGLGALISAVVGLLALKGLLKVISARKLHVFAWYCLAMGGLVIALGAISQLRT